MMMMTMMEMEMEMEMQMEDEDDCTMEHAPLSERIRFWSFHHKSANAFRSWEALRQLHASSSLFGAEPESSWREELWLLRNTTCKC